MVNIKFGTDGWRAIIAKEFTTENVARVAYATGLWLNKKHKNPSVVIGFDCRFAGKLFSETTAKVLASMGIKVYMAKYFVSTPMVSYGVVKYKTDLGVVITASHNSYEYNGYKLKGSYGGPLLGDETLELENLIPDENKIDLESLSIDKFIKDKMVEIIPLEDDYISLLKNNFDIDSIQNSKFNFAFDAMYGAGQNVFKNILQNTTLLHCSSNPSFNGIAPEPLHRNLLEFSYTMKSSKKLDCGLAVDGDADRIALYDSEGKYIDSHHILLLLIHYLVKYKKMTGKIVTGFSSTIKMEKMCKHYNLDLQRVKIGFKEICNHMLTENVLVGGEESGGIAISTHIPERDGIWNGLTLWQAMVDSGKSLSELIAEVYEITGSFAFERSDLKLPEELKLSTIEKCKNGEFKEFGKYKVQKVETLDGFKFFLSENQWVMIRPSGTEPLLRTYAEAETKEIALDILAEAYKVIMK